MPEGSLEFAEGAGDGDVAGLDVDGDALGDLELFFGEDVLHYVDGNN